MLEKTMAQPVTLSSRVGCAPDERLALRSPRAPAHVARAIWRLPPRSWIRRKLLGRAVRLGFEATNRGDQEACFMLYHPDVESIWPPEIVALGFDPPDRGRRGRIEAQRRWGRRVGSVAVRTRGAHRPWRPRAGRGPHLEGSGLNSGAAVELNDWAVLYTFSEGQVVREQIYVAKAEALAAAGVTG